VSAIFATAFWLGLAAYAGAGALVALWLIAGALQRFDPEAARAPWRVKLLLVPGMLALWPVLIARALGVRPREDRA